jgi:hypothetical protein
MWDIWSFASAIAGNTAVRSDDLDVLSPEDSGDEEDSDGPRWFSDDLPHVKKATTSSENKASWFTRLTRVSSTILLQLIYVYSKYYDVNGKLVAMSKQTTINIMGRIPTPPAPDGSLPPFPFHAAFTLSDWVPYILEGDVDSLAQAKDDAHASLDATIRSVMSGEPGPLDKRAITEIASADKKANSECSESLAQTFQSEGGDLTYYTENDFTNVLAFPLAQVYPESIPEFASLFVNASIYGQASLMIARIDNELKRFHLLKRQLTAAELTLTQDKGRLENMLHVYEETKAELDNMSSTWSSTRREHAKVYEQVSIHEQNPILKEFAMRPAQHPAPSMGLQFGGQPQSPFVSPNIGQASVPSYPTAYGQRISSLRKLSASDSTKYVPRTEPV